MDTRFTPSKDPRYVAARRAYKKAMASLENAREYLWQTGSDGSYDPRFGFSESTFETVDAQALLDAAANRVNAEMAQIDKQCGVAVYSPYGSRGARRW